jgi:Leucine-rich repeat (LRR) protein
MDEDEEDEDIIKLDISVKHLRILYLKTYTQLVELDCGYNHIQRLPKLPDTLKKLNCSSNLLNTLPRLPKLEELSCCENSLDRIKLPNTIKIFYCYSNFIKNLKLPNYLEVLNCRNNVIETLELNKHLRELECSKNKLTYITFNESLTEANISYNRIKKISNLPNSILTLNIKCTDIDECFHIPKQLDCIYSYGTPIYNKLKCFIKTEQHTYYTFIISYTFEHIKRID